MQIVEEYAQIKGIKKEKYQEDDWEYILLKYFPLIK